tara:strand:- start:123 stop:935 length:813 start_codon:yes stop_codon:yes gene_type:complete
VQKNSEVIDLGKKDIRLFVATPVHSDVTIHYMQSVIKLQTMCHQKNVSFTLQLMKSSLVTQGRNLCVAQFLDSDFTHLLFIDSDILFSADSIFKMIEKDMDLLSIPYPMKIVQWEKIFNKYKDYPDRTILEASTSGNMFPVRIKDQEHDIKVDNEMIELSHTPTGCLMLKRSVLEKMIKHYPELNIRQETVVDGEKVLKPNLYNFFDTYYDKETKRYYGEDFAFSRLWNKIGGKCHALITEYITHVGEFQYTGRLIDEMIPQSIDTSTKK